MKVLKASIKHASFSSIAFSRAVKIAAFLLTRDTEITYEVNGDIPAGTVKRAKFNLAG